MRWKRLYRVASLLLGPGIGRPDDEGNNHLPGLPRDPEALAHRPRGRHEEHGPPRQPRGRRGQLHDPGLHLVRKSLQEADKLAPLLGRRAAHKPPDGPLLPRQLLAEAQRERAVAADIDVQLGRPVRRLPQLLVLCSRISGGFPAEELAGGPAAVQQCP